ncbi:uncharacterized protein BP5553_08678 [Venustampulla echinocandica]|uniref:Peptidase A1 domain-containing protein n=1 Tax=Venustampulla echinocandica TaxID=2656787 RepID=A0A370TEY2_9HELO|nr:uncharacterized protein BP5553_08678 [Venustampulla echinocandica]RDL33239.1 hypothetical protein BP5553_08678 [Venustampulla echinocandica]
MGERFRSILREHALQPLLRGWSHSIIFLRDAHWFADNGLERFPLHWRIRDQSRVVGTVTYQPLGQNWLPIDLLDIGIGVAVGESPFNFTSKANLLVQDNDIINRPLSVTVEPRDPHLHLPRSSCDAIAELIPMVFSPDLGLHLWDTNSPLYSRITTSPAVLSFTFRLSRSVTSNGLKYFPCAPLPVGATTPNGAPAAILDRAFLQAAFIGVNWSDQSGATWFMAQAPGPNTPETVSVEAISSEKTNIVPSQNEWIQTWDGGWGVLKKDGTTASISVPTATGSGVSNAETPNAGSLSIAAKFGVGIGKKRAKRNQQIGRPIQADHDYKESCNNETKYGGFMPGELEVKYHGEQDRRFNSHELDSHRATGRIAELG